MGLFDFFNRKKREQEEQLRRKKEEERKREVMFAEIRKRQEEREKEEKEMQKQLRLQQEAELKRRKEEQQKLEEIHNQEEIKREDHDKKGNAYLVIFSTCWCGPSKRFIKEIEEAGITNFTVIDVEKEEALSSRFGISSVPTVILLDEHDNIIKKWLGYDDEDPGQSKFVNYIKNSPYIIQPYSALSNAEQISDRCQAEQDILEDAQSSIIEDFRTQFYNLEDIKFRSMGNDLMLAPYDAFSYFNYPDAEVLPILANSQKIQHYLPGLGFTDKVSTKKRLESFMLKTENQLGVTYVIRVSNMPVGMVLVNTPLYNKKTINLAIWTIDFYISEAYEHTGLMYHSILRVLNEMKNFMGAKAVYAMVDKKNYDCINVIGKGLFNQIDNTGFHDGRGGDAPLVYMIDLSLINFKRG